MKIKIELLIILCFCILFTIAPAKASASLTAYWKFDDGSGTAPVDSSGNNITGAFSGTTQPTWSTDVPSVSFSDPYSLSFVGTGDGVLFNWPTGLNMNATDPRSFSFWFKPTGPGENSGNFSRLVSWTGDRFEIAGSDSDYTNHKLSFYDGVSWRSTNYTMSLNTWYHITFTFDGSTEHLYIGDTEQFSTTTTNNSLSGVVGIGTRINSTPHNEGVNGLIDDVRIYSNALTSSQIANLTAGSNNPDTPPDTTPPAISAVDSTASSSGATITWTTDEAASTKVIYSADTSYASSTTESDTSSRVTSHSKTLSNLLSCTLYNYKTISADAAGNYATSTASSLTTTGCTGNATPSASTSTSISVSTSSTVSLSDSSRTLSITTPSNFTATSSSIVIQIKSLSSDTVLGSISKPLSSLSSAAVKAFDVSALIDNTTVLDSFNSAVTVSYTYTDADISGLDESSLKMYHYHNGTWLQLDSCSVDTIANKITCTAPSFSIFAIFGTSNSSSQSTYGGGLPPAAYYKPNVPSGGFKLALQKTSDTKFNVLSNAGKDVAYIALSLNPTFKDVGLIPYSQSFTWDSCSGINSCPNGEAQVYAMFYTYWGQRSDIIKTKITITQTSTKGLNSIKTNAVTCPYFIKYQREGDKGQEIIKIKQFLNSTQDSNLPLTITYDKVLTNEVKKFQVAYSSEILAPWGFTKPTGRWYQSTSKQANALLGCDASVKLDNGTVLP